VELSEIMSLRFKLESWALELAKPRITPAILDRLGELHADMLGAARRGDVRGFTNTDFSFHKLMWETSGHALLAETLQRIAGPVFAFADIALSQAGFDCSRLAELHRPLVEYLSGASETPADDVLREVFDYTFQTEWEVLFQGRDKERN
jgi:DNA-binding GntR family transcriptional regulator